MSRKVIVIGILVTLLLASTSLLLESRNDVDADSIQDITISCGPMTGKDTPSSAADKRIGEWDVGSDCRITISSMGDGPHTFLIAMQSVSFASLSVVSDDKKETINAVINDDGSYSGNGELSGISIDVYVKHKLGTQINCSVNLSIKDATKAIDVKNLSFTLTLYGKMNGDDKIKTIPFELILPAFSNEYKIGVSNDIDAILNKDAIFIHRITKIDGTAIDADDLVILRGGGQSNDLTFPYDSAYQIKDKEIEISGSDGVTHKYMTCRTATASAGDLIFIGLNPGYATCSVKTSSGDVVEVHESKRYESVDGVLQEVEGHSVFWFEMPTSSVMVDVKFSAHKLAIESEHGTVSARLSGSDPSSYTGVNSRINNYFFEGDSILLDCEPSDGYEFTGFEVVSKNASIGADNTFTMPGSDVSIKAEYSIKSYSIAYPSVQNGTVSGSSTAEYGSSVTISVIPSSGYKLASISATSGGKNLTLNEVSGGYSFIMPAGNVQLSAEFVADNSSLTCVSKLSGANTILDVSIDCGESVSSESDLRILVIAKYGDNVINVYSKPVIGADGKGSDMIVVSSQGLTSVVLELVDGIQPGEGGAVKFLCYHIYVPQSAGA